MINIFTVQEFLKKSWKKFFGRSFQVVPPGVQPFKFVRSFKRSTIQPEPFKLVRSPFVRFVRSFNSFDPYTRIYARYAYALRAWIRAPRTYIIRRRLYSGSWQYPDSARRAVRSQKSWIEKKIKKKLKKIC